MRALGIDVAVARGRALDVVILDGDRTVVRTERRVQLHELGPLLRQERPDAVAIDSPPAWARRGRTRRTERDIRLLGIQSYGTPVRDRGTSHSFYEWMRTGFEVFGIARANGYPRYRGGDPRGTALEVFPHATAVVLAGCLPPAGWTKRDWRARVLASGGVATEGLRSADQIDAALSALTALLALEGRRSALGDPTEGQIVLPSRTLPARPYRRCVEPPPAERQPHLPGMSPCACGDTACDRLTAGEFAPGHDAKRKSLLWRLARQGQDAADELRRRGWKMPPEMR